MKSHSLVKNAFVFENKMLLQIQFGNNLFKYERLCSSKYYKNCDIEFSFVNQFLREDKNKNLLKNILSKINGVLIGEDDNYVIIVTDHYGILPIYMYTEKNKIVLFSHFNEFKELKNDIVLSIDQIGVWEQIIHGLPLNDRTIYNEIKLLSPASIFCINKITGSLKRIFYDNITFPISSDANSELVGKNIEELLSIFFSRQNIEHCLLPLSGGIDSRLLAASLSKIYGSDKITAITFASSKNSYEFIYAKKVCEILGIKDWRFHLLTPDSYLRSLNVFPHRTGGMLSVAHGHLYDVLSTKNKEWEGMTLISGAFADAASGYATEDPKLSCTSLENSNYFQNLEKLNKNLVLGNIKSEITNDLQNIFLRWKDNSSIKSFNEFVYINQRQSRLLFTQSLLYQDLIPVLQPFCDNTVSEYLLSLPFEMRHFKQSLRYSIEFFNKELFNLPDISSIYRRKYLRDYYHLYRGKIFNNVAMMLTILFNDHHLFFSPYQTESQDFYLRRFHRQLVIDSIKYLLSRGILNENNMKILIEKPFKQYGGGFLTAAQYSIITMARAFNDNKVFS